MPGCEWTHDYSLCEECGILRDRGNFCPLCNVLYRDDDYDTKMMCCDTCDKWCVSHPRSADTSTPPSFQSKSTKPTTVVRTYFLYKHERNRMHRLCVPNWSLVYDFCVPLYPR